jgi:two-component system sensor histidine kinase KdpD
MANRKKREGTEARGPVVVALGPGEAGVELLRAASALARESGADLDCLTVDTGEEASAGEAAPEAETLGLARDSGARLATEARLDAAAGILEYAEKRGASALVVGMGRRRMLGRGILDRLLAARPPFPVLAMRVAPTGARARARRAPRQLGAAAQYCAAIALIAALTGLNFLIAGYAGYWAASIPYLAAISLMALALDRGPVFLAALLSAAAWDVFFIPPRFTLAVSRTEDLLILCLYFLFAISSGWLTGKLRASERLIAAREARLSRLSALAHALAGAKTMGEIVSKSVEAIEEAFDVEAIVILREGGGLKKEAESGWEPLDESAWLAASLAFSDGRAAGRFTEAHSVSEWHFVALEGPKRRLGVIGVRAAHERVWEETSESFLKTIASTVSIAVARELP